VDASPTALVCQSGGVVTTEQEASVSEVSMIGLDLAKHVFQAHGADASGKVVIHDEFAEWMLTEDYKEAVASVVQRLGVKARAAGIYLVFAAQRPDANVMPMQLRANLGNRLILRVDSEGTSEIALGEKGAERLLGRGHLLAKLEGERDLCFAQVPFVEPEFAEALVAAIRNPRQAA
jgi:DNA segregation ATPase FtsK/SpoIIIE-like protein